MECRSDVGPRRPYRARYTGASPVWSHEMNGRRFAAALGLVVLGPAVAGQQEKPQQPSNPSFRAAIDIVSLTVTVTDGANHFVTELEESDFQVFEDGVRQEASFFSRRQQPIALSMLL